MQSSYLQCRFLNSMSAISARDWDRLFTENHPFTSHAFLAALEESGAVGADTGWVPRHVVVTLGGEVQAAMPGYVKDHSYGEFVFDWGWADAYQQHGLNYYPKLLNAIPFSPVTGPRFGAHSGADRTTLLQCLLEGIVQEVKSQGWSGWHLLFLQPALRKDLENSSIGSELIFREAVQFHWQNRSYSDFNDFLQGLRSSRRKNIRRERRRLGEQGVVVERKTGSAINDEEWDAFYHCYVNTYFKRSGHAGYLNRPFFDQLRASMAEQLLLVVARQDQRIVGSALFLFDHSRLYGRYWGTLDNIDYLHFEACFYQGIEFCIERGLEVFDPGTQGEHKLLRGFEPVKTVSCHWIADHRFRAAIDQFTQREQQVTDAYQEDAENFLPFRRAGPE